MFDREIEHRLGDGHLEIDARLCGAQEHLDVARLNVAPILAEMHGDAIGARLLGEQRSRHGIRVGRAARLSHRRDVIDVDAEMYRFHATYSPRLTISCNTSRLLSGRSPRCALSARPSNLCAVRKLPSSSSTRSRNDMRSRPE